MSGLENFLETEPEAKKKKEVPEEVQKSEGKPDTTSSKGKGMISSNEKDGILDSTSDIESFKVLSKEDLEIMLKETVMNLPLFNSHLGYTRTKIYPNEPGIKPVKLAALLDISLAEALIVLDCLQKEKIQKKDSSE